MKSRAHIVLWLNIKECSRKELFSNKDGFTSTYQRLKQTSLFYRSDSEHLIVLYHMSTENKTTNGKITANHIMLPATIVENLTDVIQTYISEFH